ncbi:hypothetical protein O3Q50_13820 [Enterococcus lactis]
MHYGKSIYFSVVFVPSSFARGTAVQALEKVDPSQIRENNNLVLYHDSDSLRNIEVTGINGFKILDEYSTKNKKYLLGQKSKI